MVFVIKKCYLNFGADSQTRTDAPEGIDYKSIAIATMRCQQFVLYKYNRI